MKISLLDTTIRDQTWIHKDAIRDVRCKNDKLLCASFDSTASIIDAKTLKEIISFPTETKAWSCEWSSNEHFCYVGCQDGSVKIFDIRSPNEHVNILPKIENFVQPCHSLSAISRQNTSLYSKLDENCIDILLSGCMNGVASYANMQDNTFSFSSVLSPELNGRCISVSYDEISNYCIASYRSTVEYSKPSHHVSKIFLPR